MRRGATTQRLWLLSIAFAACIASGVSAGCTPSECSSNSNCASSTRGRVCVDGLCGCDPAHTSDAGFTTDCPVITDGGVGCCLEPEKVCGHVEVYGDSYTGLSFACYR